MNKALKSFGLVILIFIVISAIFTLINPQALQKNKEIALSALVQDINQGQVSKIDVSGTDLKISFKNGDKVVSRKEVGSDLGQTLKNLGVVSESLNQVEVNVNPERAGVLDWLMPLSFILPLIVFGIFFWLIFRQAKAGSGQTFNFLRSPAKLFDSTNKEAEKITFKDVAGLEEAKEEVKEIVDFLKNPQKFLDMGAKIPKGVLLIGPPGCGKTLLARAVANEAGVPFYAMSGSEFIELFVGVGASITGDTPILIRTKSQTKLLPIKELVDQFYPEGKEGYNVPIFGIETLGYQSLNTKFGGASKNSDKKYFEKSVWQPVKSVYRHEVKEIYEIHYLGGKIKTTGDHSVFVRHHNLITTKRVKDIKPGEILVNLPFKVRGVFVSGIGTTHKVKSHDFSQYVFNQELPVWNESFQIEETQRAYDFAIANKGILSQKAIAEQIGVNQMTVCNWQRKTYAPLNLYWASKNTDKGIPQKIKTSPDLLKLLGYYTAEGRRTEYMLQFVFGLHEEELHNDCINLMEKIFNVKPRLEETSDNTLRITYNGKVLADFFEKHCGNGSKNKHVPEFLWYMPKEHFLHYLEGWTKGDGYTTKEGRLVVCSISKQLILEMAWLCSMHGLQVGIRHGKNKGGRIIKNKPLPESEYWTIKIGKTSHPFQETARSPFQFKKPKVIKVVKKPYDGYVYDLCGCGNEAFFGGEKPTLLHNSRARSLFETAKKNQPSIVFIDEIDSIGKVRGVGMSGGHEEREQTLNQILAEMDGFEKNTQVIVMSATNRPEYLDPALLRPGRFDRRIILDEPDIKGREEILQIHSKGKPLANAVVLREVAERTPGFSGADLANLMNEAAILATRRNKKQIDQIDILESIEKVLLGPERKSHLLSQKEKRVSAFHETGHALVSAILPNAEEVRKISIIARGMAAGYTLALPKEEKRMHTKAEFMAELAVLLAGYVAEHLELGEISTGASNDLEKASLLARKMVTKFGMSSLGPISFGKRETLEFIGWEQETERNYSDKVAQQIDKETEKFIKEAQGMATKVLKQKRALLRKIAKVLMEKETIEKEEFEKLIGKK